MAQVAKLQQARERLEKQLSVPVSAAITGHGLVLRVHADDPEGVEVPAAFEGFPVEVRQVPKAP